MEMTNSPTLYGDFLYGMAKNAIVECTNAKSSAQNPLILLAPGQIQFLGMDWQQQFFLNNQEELQQVVLAAANPDMRENVARDLEASGWQPAFLESPDSALDYLLETRSEGASRAAEMASKLAMSALAKEGDLAISFLPAEIAQNAISKGLDFNQAIDNAGEDLIVIRMMASTDNLRLSFTAPLLSRKNALRYGQKIRRN